jgi:hypothetical protein
MLICRHRCSRRQFAVNADAAYNAGAPVDISKNTYASAKRASVVTVNATIKRAYVVSKNINAAAECTLLPPSTLPPLPTPSPQTTARKL